MIEIYIHPDHGYSHHETQLDLVIHTTENQYTKDGVGVLEHARNLGRLSKKSNDNPKRHPLFAEYYEVMARMWSAAAKSSDIKDVYVACHKTQLITQEYITLFEKNGVKFYQGKKT